MHARKTAIALVVTLSVLGLASQAWAEKGGKRVQFGIVYSSPTGDFVDEGETTELDSATGFQASFEYMLTDRVGVEPAIGFLDHDVTVREAGFPDLDLADTSLVLLTANVNFHLMQDKKVDLFVGPTVGYAFWGDLKSDLFEENFPTDDDFVFGANLGVVVPFGEGAWAFAGSVGYLLSDLTPEGSGADIGVDPFQLKAGLSYQF
jgi:hypothetical protein